MSENNMAKISNWYIYLWELIYNDVLAVESTSKRDKRMGGVGLPALHSFLNSFFRVSAFTLSMLR